MIPGFSERHEECYVIVSDASRVDNTVTFPTCLLNLQSRVLLFIWIIGSHYYRMMSFRRECLVTERAIEACRANAPGKPGASAEPRLCARPPHGLGSIKTLLPRITNTSNSDQN